ncbi:class I mannose-6-phosphate isomerase [Gryllotalpicola protaetiae]|uniref:Mannose-6-phosphate isomerase n=1 Tax=Gryllotalpicola protaetiae TaxID=2419771 RepID=A0A387BE90_9MICO|nr:class I mannose-6-phosphate isomerase [Gryllotalpicola protaetiae]AYG02285.1 hypothetical protein D7I44_01220 [Gryllotalpicola protaetiae]
MTTTHSPILLDANQPAARPYRGGAGIARFRGLPFGGDDRTPEDFVGSTTTVHGSDAVGLTTLPDGTLLRDAITADPSGFLGPEHVGRFGTDPRLLVKLLNTGERLFVHAHPGDDFAHSVLHEPYGKTEAWIVMEGESEAWLGFTHDVSADDVAGWFERQDAAAMLAAMHRVSLRAGDTLLVPAGLPHAIGPGLTIVELQQPVDLSLLLEYAGRPGLDAGSALLGLTLAETMPALRTTALTTEELAGLRGTLGDASAPVGRLFPTAADPFFAAALLRPALSVQLAPGFSIVVVTEGGGTLSWSAGELGVSRGTTALIPYGAGFVTFAGDLTAIAAFPPGR